MYKSITGKCKYMLDNEFCLGCNRLELEDFTGDDDCQAVKEFEKHYADINKQISINDFMGGTNEISN